MTQQKKYRAGWSADYSALTDVVLQTATQNYRVHAAKFDSPLISGVVAAVSEASSKSLEAPVVTLDVQDTVLEAVLEFVYLNASSRNSSLTSVPFRDMLKTLDFLGSIAVFDTYCEDLGVCIKEWSPGDHDTAAINRTITDDGTASHPGCVIKIQKSRRSGVLFRERSRTHRTISITHGS